MVAILLGNGFEESEAVVPADLLRRAGIETSFVGVDSLSVTGSHGMTLQADLTLEQLNVEGLQMLILPGGLGGVESIQRNLFALALVQKAWDGGCYLAAICAAPTLLAHLGILDRRRAVCFPGMENHMGSAVIHAGARVVVDGRIITAEAAGSSFAFGLKLVELLKGESAALEVQNAIHYH